MSNHGNRGINIRTLTVLFLTLANVTTAQSEEFPTSWKAGWMWGPFGVAGTSTDPMEACQNQMKYVADLIPPAGPKTGTNIFTGKLRLGKLNPLNPVTPICIFYNDPSDVRQGELFGHTYTYYETRQTQLHWICASGEGPDESGNCVKPGESSIPPQYPKCDVTSPKVGDPISIETGNVEEEVVDFQTAGPLPFALKRFYRSRVRPGYNFGTSRWRYDFEYDIIVSSDIVNLTTPDGNYYQFYKNDDGSYKNRDPLSFVTLVMTQPNYIEISFKDGRRVVFYIVDFNQTQWRPIQVFNPNGQILKIDYGRYSDYNIRSVSDNFGRKFTFTTSNGGITIESATYTSGTNSQPSFKINYDYKTSSAEGVTYDAVLRKMTRYSSSGGSDWSEVNHISYLSENNDLPSLMTGMVDERGIRVSTWNYDQNGRGISSESVNGINKDTVSYDERNQTVAHTNPLGLKTTYNMSTYGKNRNSGSIYFSETNNVPASNISVKFDQNGRISQRIDQDGRPTTYARDEYGRPTQIIYGSQGAISSTTISWDKSLDLPAKITESGLQTDISYNTAGQTILVKQTDITSQSVPFSTNGRSRVWSYEYETNGLLKSVDGPIIGAGYKTFYKYNSEGYVKEYTNPAGQVTTITDWNYRGQPTSITGVDGVVMTYAYDNMGRATQVVINPGSSQTTWSMTYTAAGDLASYTEPAGATYTLTWDDARRLTKVQNNLGEAITYDRDAMGNLTGKSIIAGDGQTQMFGLTNSFDELGRLIKQVGGEGRTWSYAYDKTGNLTGVTDPRSKTLGYGFDAVSRLVSETERDGGVVTHAYNGKGEETTYTDPRGLATAYVRNGFGEVIQETSPDRGTTVYDYDARGLMISKTDARGVTATYTYDVAGRLTSRAYPNAALNESFTYDGASAGAAGTGRLTRMQDAGGSSDFYYDAAGRVTGEVRTIGGYSHTVAYGYDGSGNGHLRFLTYPSGRVVVYGYDGLGRVNYVGLKASADGPEQAIASWAGYFPFGPVRGFTFGNGLSSWSNRSLEYKLDGLFLDQASGGPSLIERYHWYGDGLNLMALNNDSIDPAQTQRFNYDDAGRLVGGTGPWGSLSWSYDAVGNRLGEDRTASGSTTSQSYAYPSDSNRLGGISQDGTVVRSFLYDAAGNLTSDAKLGTTTAYTISDAGRIAQVSVGGVVRANYLYDGKNRLSVRETLNSTPSGTQHLIHDVWDHVLVETNGAGQAVREYVWVGDIPVAVVDSSASAESPTLLWVHVDHLGRPELMTDAAKAVQWRAVYEPFGAVSSITGPASLQMRFPGQWFQLEAGLAYNWNRHYDATTGRYTQPDPLGVAAGTSVYGYAQASPLQMFDRDGRFAVMLPAIYPTIAAAILGAGTYIYSDKIEKFLSYIVKNDKYYNDNNNDTIKNCPIPGVKRTGRTKGNTEMGEKDGGIQQQGKDFDDIAGEERPTSNPDIRLKELPDGRTASTRPYSTKDQDGRPTIDIRSGGRTTIKIRYNP